MKRLSLALAMMAAALQCFGAVRLPSVLGDGMVIQRNQPIKIWGWAEKGEEFTILWNGDTYAATASEEGKWETVLPAMPAGGPHSMQICDIVL